jgi:hypothetical protein
VPFTLAIANPGNDSIQYTLSGLGFGESATIWRLPIDDEFQTNEWLVTGLGGGNGTLTESGVGASFLQYHWWKAVHDSTGEVSNLVYQNLTDGNENIHYRCQEAIQSRIRNLLLEDIASGSVIIRKVPDPRSTTFPLVVICPGKNENMNPLAGTNAMDDVGYPVTVLVVESDNQTLETDHAKYLLWRRKIAAAFRGQRLPGVPEIMTCTIEPADIVSQTAWFKNIFVTALTVRCNSREDRGLI